MVNAIVLDAVTTLIFGTCAMLLMVIAIIAFAFLFQRKLLKKQEAYRQIERLLQKEELKSAYSIMEGKEIERKRIAADLHDNIGSMLATLRMYSDLVQEKLTDQSEVKRLSRKIAELTEAAANETRRIAHDLDSGHISRFGINKALRELCNAIREAQKLDIVLNIDELDHLHGELPINIYRMIQELFNNTLKHAVASSVQLSLSQVGKEYISIIFEDNGVGFDPQAIGEGMGLQNIRARVNRFSGSFSIHSTLAKGTTVIIEMPLL